MQMTAFIGDPTTTMVVLLAKIIVRLRTSTIGFFIVNAKPSCSILLGRDWLHSNFCVLLMD